MFYNSPKFWLYIVQLAILLLTLGLGWVTYQSNLLLKKFQPSFNLLLSPPELAVRLLLVGLCIFLAWLSGLPADQLGLIVRQPIRSIALGASIGVVIQLGLYLVTWWAVNHYGRQIYSPTVVRNILPRHPIEWPLVCLAFIPAVTMEELLFRTLWLGAFSGTIPILGLVLGTSVIFGLMHQPQGLLGVILTGSINIVFCFLFIWTGELLIPLIAHYTLNILQLVVASFQQDWLEDY